MKKTMLIALAALLVLAFAVSLVSAAKPAAQPPQFTAQAVTLTDAQKQELAPLFNQMVEIRKQIIQKQVSFGNLTQEQADQRIAWMQQRMEQGFGPGMMNRGPGMMGHGPGMMGRGPGFGPMGQQQQPATK